MTTHNQKPQRFRRRPAQPEFSSTTAEVPGTAQSEPLAHSEPPQAEMAAQNAEVRATAAGEQLARSEPTAHGEPSAQPESAQAETVPSSAEAQPSADELLFAADPSGLRSRWDEIQAAFVDDPADCVQKADRLVTEIVDQLTAVFSEARSRLESQWARGEQEASTEDLRQALQRYREFFQRLLAV